MLYIIADDLTGAGDTGVQLAKKGYKTLVSINPLVSLSTSQDKESNVFVIDTETRNLSQSKARNKLTQIMGKLNITEQSLFYKKIDSTMRGNIGVEIETILNCSQTDICLLCPSFPDNQRITIGGYLLVDNQPLGCTEYNEAGLDKADASFLPALLKKQTSLPIGQLHLKDIFKGEDVILHRLTALYKENKKVIIADAVNNDQLGQIMAASSRFQGSILYAGSAGLANHISKLTKFSGKVKLDKFGQDSKQYFSAPGREQSVMVVVGSRKQIMLEQIDYLTDKISFINLKIDLLDIFKNKEIIAKRYVNKAIKAINQKKHLVLQPDPVYNNTERIEKLLIDKQLSFRQLEIKIRDFLAAIASDIILTGNLHKLILTGGDTALGVCKSLEIYNLQIIKEILSGIPLTTTTDQNYRIITKAGGFGQKETLYRLIKELER